MYYKHGRPVSATDGVLFAGGADAAIAYDPPNLADGWGTTAVVVPVPGAAMGDFVAVSYSENLQDIIISGWVSTPGTVAVRFQNESSGPVDLPAGTIRVRVTKA
jgi:hypothetical protein